MCIFTSSNSVSLYVEIVKDSLQGIILASLAKYAYGSSPLEQDHKIERIKITPV